MLTLNCIKNIAIYNYYLFDGLFGGLAPLYYAL